MSDITKAFEILVSMDPTQATGAFKSIVDSQEKTTTSFEKFLNIGAAFNQLWELIGKGADVIGDMAASVIDLADSGGELNEVEGNFKSLAASAGIAGDDFLKTIKKVTDGNISLKDSAALSSAAIVQGFTGEQITSAFKFAQQLSDQGKGKTEDLFRTITESTAKGRTASLAAFGIIAESGASAAQVFGLIDEKISKAGEGFFNFGDNLKSITTSFGDFKDRVGQALNQSEAFQKIVIFLTGTVSEFVNSFDFSQIGKTFDFIIKAGIEVAKSLGIDFGDIKNYIAKAFSGGADSVKAFAIDAVRYIGEFGIAIIELYNDTLDTFGKLNGLFVTFINSLQLLAAQIAVAFDGAWNDVENGLTQTLVVMLGELDKFQAVSATLLGIDPTDEITTLANELNNVYIASMKSAKEATKENEAFLDSLGANLEQNTEKASHVYDGLKINTTDLGTQLDDFTNRLSTIAPELISNNTDKTVENTRKGIDELRKEMEDAQTSEKARIKEHENLVTEAYKREADAAKEAFAFGQGEEEKAFRRSQEDALEAYKKELETRREFRTSADEGIRFSGNVDQRELDLREKAIKEFRRSQEDALDLFKFQQKQKQADLSQTQKVDINRDETADEVKKLVEIQEESAKKASEPQKQQVFKLKLEPTGNNALDVLLENLLATAEIRAEAELVQVIAG